MIAQLEDGRRGDLRRRRRAGPGRQEALRAARRDRHRRGDPADRALDHEQEDRRGHRRARARRQGRHRRVHEGPSTTPASSPRRWSRSARTPGCTPSRCSPTCPRRSGSPPATRSRSRESVEVLAGGGPADVVELTLALAREMLAGAGRDDVDPADKLADGSRDGRLAAMIRAQGGDPDARAARRRGRPHVVTAPADGRADPARRDGGRPGRVAARCRPGPQGGPGAGRRRRRSARPARATRSPRGSRC